MPHDPAAAERTPSSPEAAATAAGPASGPAAPRVPTPQEIEAIGLVPLLAPYLRQARGQMPDDLRAAFEAHSLTPRHGAVLPQLLAEQPLAVGELAQRLRLSLSTTSELVGALSRAGLVERREDPANRRRTLVAIPADRLPVVQEFITARSQPMLRALDSLSPRDRAGFIAGLTAWAREVQAQDGATAAHR
ncbi:MarR family winged helix-turn-helix transcriptional regulator [Streptomyces albireticuli]|uniref:MarR family transcriptional regulator n=1 Tax=Streptomyces albireticuli TaxID=1940 RepID=A0A2A2DBJ4_9ACTN|nr:MarR family transcriptional regulator [Streptomyces albireticuli]MCD9144401.1 MarR family transcriptional regulator [Streptomyces albireticuli]MCD9163536.1 MarR family transcriptional regulator [Streptomyces albireticuli]MCD9193078.1 MarR family transcriptional regulator [Streptomyces albireticuli]PAU48806.1 MarR family transcriptional regulator [Streptomyces albireticuli]